MYATRSRFDNRYITKEFRELDLKRLREGRETVLPLSRRERAKYVTVNYLSSLYFILIYSGLIKSIKLIKYIHGYYCNASAGCGAAAQRFLLHALIFRCFLYLTSSRCTKQ